MSQLPELTIDGQQYLQCECGDLYPTKSYGAGFMAANDGVCENCDAEQVTIPGPVARNLLGELYQILGALDAGAKVLDQVSAAIHGQPLPHETLLPYVGQAGAMEELRRSVAEILGEYPETWPSHGNAALAIASTVALCVRAQPDGVEHELLGYIEPPALLDLLQGSNTTATIRSALPCLTNPAPGPGDSWAVPIYVVRRPVEPQ